MIQLRKSPNAPASLAGKKTWNGEDVQKTLYADQDGKCYLCESCTGKNYQIDHLRSRKNYPEKAYDWANLFLCCGYCNGRKSDQFDDIVSPCDVPCEEIFDIILKPECKAVEISVRQPDIPGVGQTRELLHRLHNGKREGMRDIREKIFYDELCSVVLNFARCLREYKNDKTPENRAEVVEFLKIDQPFLAAKKSLLRSCSDLFEDFRHEMLWNRARSAGRGHRGAALSQFKMRE